MSTTEQNVRTAAQKLHDAIRDAENAGYAITYPRGVEELPNIAVSETAAIATTAQVTVAGDVPDDVAAKAAVAATKAAERVVDRAAGKS